MNFSSSFSASSSSSNTVTPLPPQLFPSPSLPPSSLPFTPFHLRQPSSFNRELNPFLTSNLSSSSSSTSSNEPSFEPSLPHSQSAQLNSIGRCKGYFWNLDCKIISTRPQRCDSCYQGFTVNFNLLRIKIESDPYPYKNFTHISPTELAIKFNNTEEAESVSKFDPKLKPYVSPYGRMGEERFFYCAGKCNKIALNHPGISFPKNTPKSRVGCCLWTLQRRGKGRPLLIKQPDPRSSAPLSPEGGTNFSTPPPEAPPTLPHLPLYSSPLPSNFSSYSIPYSATEIPVVDHSDGPDEPDEPDDFDDLYASGLSSLIYPSLPINAKKAPLPIGSFPPSFLPPPSSSSNSPLSLPSNPSTQPPFSLPYNPSPFSFPTIPLALPSDSQYVSTGIHSEASNKKIPVVDHSEEPDQPDDFDDLYASKLSSLLYPSLPINAKKAPLPIGSLIPCFLPAPSSSSSSPLSPPRNASTQPPFSLPYNPSPFSFPTIQLDLPSFDSQSVSTTAIDLEASNLADPLSSNPSEPLPSALSPSRPPTPHPFSPVPLEIPAPVGDFDNLDCLDSLENLDGLDDYSFTTIPPAPFPSSPSNRSTPQSFNLFPPLSPLPFSSGASLNNTGDDISLTATSSFTNLKMTPMVDQATAIGQYLTIQLHMPEFTPLLILKDLKVEFAGVQINFEIMRTFIKIEIPRSYFSNEYLKFLRFRQIECEFPDTVVIRNAKELETQYKITLFSTDKTDPLFEKWLTLKNHLLENFQTE